MGKVEKTRLERNWTTFVNPAFSAAWKSPPKMVAWKRNFKIGSQGCFFVSPQRGNLTKRGLNAIGPLSWTRLFPLLGKANPKWWHETEIVKFDPKAVFSLRPDWESWKNAFWTQLDDLRQPGFFRCLEKPTQNGGWKRNFKIGSQGCFFVSPRWGNLTKRVLNAIGGPSSTRLFPLLGKAHTKWWHETEILKFDQKAVFFVWPRWEKLKKRVLNAIGRPSSTRLFPLLGKAHPKWWHENEILKLDPKGVFSFPPDGEI